MVDSRERNTPGVPIPEVVSADEHLVEPPSFWRETLPQALPAADWGAAPELVGAGLSVDGQVLPTFRRFPDLAAVSDAQPGASDVPGRLAVMDREGIGMALLFPQRAMGMFALADDGLLVRCIDVYNAWLADLCASSVGRLHGVAILPSPRDPERSVQHIERIAELGFKVCMMPGRLRGRSLADPALAPMWSALAASDLVLAFHTSEAPDDEGPGELGAYLAVQFQPFRKLWSYLVFSGLFESHPELRVLFAEGGISWIPSALDHADQIHRDFADHLVPTLPRPPSDYWHQQCYATFMDDQRGVEQIDHIGVDRVLWSSDYPHPEGTGGRSRRMVQSLIDQLGHEVGTAVVGGNARRLLALPGAA